MTEPVFLDVPGLAQALGVKVSTVYEWTAAKGPQSVPRYKLGKGYRFDLIEVIQWVKATRDARASRLGAPVPRRRLRRPRRDAGRSRVEVTS